MANKGMHKYTATIKLVNGYWYEVNNDITAESGSMAYAQAKAIANKICEENGIESRYESIMVFRDN